MVTTRNRSLRLAGPVRPDLPGATAAAMAYGHRFPFSDDPDGYSNAICPWWADNRS